MLPCSQSFLGDVLQPTSKNWFIQFAGMPHKGDPSLTHTCEKVALLLKIGHIAACPHLVGIHPSRYAWLNIAVNILTISCSPALYTSFGMMTHPGAFPRLLSFTADSTSCSAMRWCSTTPWFRHGRQLFLILLNIEQISSLSSAHSYLNIAHPTHSSASVGLFWDDFPILLFPGETWNHPPVPPPIHAPTDFKS